MSRTVYYDENGYEIDPPKADIAPQTKADRIRAMTIEELATAMYKGCGDINWSACRIPKVCEERGVISLSEEEEDEICVQCWIDWLKSPAEEKQ